MFASLKSKIKEETGSDLSKLTSSWRTGAFLGRITLRDDSSTASPSSSAEHGDSTSDSVSPQLESYLSDRTGGQIDQAALHQQYSSQLEVKLQERDMYWEQKIEELKISYSSAQGSEAAAAQAVARAAQAEAARAVAERAAADKHLAELAARLSVAEAAQDRLDALTEELEQSRREWSRDRAELSARLAAAEARASDLADELALVKAALPADHELHHMCDDDKRAVKPSGCEDLDRVCRERAVLTRQLQESKMALADVKTSWSSQIASLETQVARLSRQAGEEGAERRRVEKEKLELQEKLFSANADTEKIKQNLINSEAKDKTMDLQSRIEALQEENRALNEALENERVLVTILREKLDKTNKLFDEQKAEFNHLNSVVTDIQHDFIDVQRKMDKEKRAKDEALLRNAHMSQTIEMSQCNVRYQETEISELKSKITDLEALIAQHKEIQAESMLIKQTEESRKTEIEQLKRRIDELTGSEVKLKSDIQDLETEICDKNKKIKSLDNRIADMKKTLQKEVQQNNKSDLTSAEEQDISRRYLKHVILRFLTARELEARQLTRALAVLLRLSAHEEALLRAALPPRTGFSAWFPSLNNT